jgi:hypothetical protein
MRFRLKEKIGLSLASAVALLAVTALPAEAQAPETPNKCELRISQPIQAGGDSATVRVSMSEAIGQLRSAEVESASGVRVVSVRPQPGDPPTAAEVTLNASEAKEGEWTLTLRGQESECSGTLQVQGG